MTVRVTSASEAAALDAESITSGVPSRALMRVAATNAATIIAEHCATRLVRGVVVFTGAGNNGGDGWAVARALSRSGVRCVVREVAVSRSIDARAERDIALSLFGEEMGAPGVVVDAVLGTGAEGEPRGKIAAAVKRIESLRSNGAFVVALDVPSGLDASNGSSKGAVKADLTIAFGSVKRGALISRASCGEIVVVDIGLSDDSASLPTLIDAPYVRANAPVIAPDANKGTRKHVAIVAGGEGMGGAAIVAGMAALRTGAGLVKIITSSSNIASVHERLPEALASSLDDHATALGDWPDAILIGPGLGSGKATADLVTSVTRAAKCPMVIDADALNAFAGDMRSLASLLAGKSAVITPHPAEMARLTGGSVADVLDGRWDTGLAVARELGCTVLLKGTPTVISSVSGERMVVASGTAALATGGSGDALGGGIATLLSQGCSLDAAAACAAWVQGRAAELTAGVRGVTLEDIVASLRDAWKLDDHELRYPRLALLPALA